MKGVHILNLFSQGRKRQVRWRAEHREQTWFEDRGSSEEVFWKVGAHNSQGREAGTPAVEGGYELEGTSVIPAPPSYTLAALYQCDVNRWVQMGRGFVGKDRDRLRASLCGV